MSEYKYNKIIEDNLLKANFPEHIAYLASLDNPEIIKKYINISIVEDFWDCIKKMDDDEDFILDADSPLNILIQNKIIDDSEFYFICGQFIKGINGCLSKINNDIITGQYISSFQLFQKLNSGRTSIETFEKMLEENILFISELGNEIYNKNNACILQEILKERWKRRKATIITTNLSPNEIEEKFSKKLVIKLKKDFILLTIIDNKNKE